MSTASLRMSYFISFLVILAIFGAAFYLQYAVGLEPCPLCILQRLSLAVLGVVFFLGWILPARKFIQLLIGSLSLLVSVLGIFFSARQVWLQHMPPAPNTQCAPSLQYMLQALPFNEVVQKVFEGTAECTKVSWHFLSLSLAEWSMVAFIFFATFSIYQLIRKLK